jgi:hypothetical protein
VSNFTFSYSSLSDFNLCPRKFYRTRVAKDVSEPERDHLVYGKEAHEAAEHYGRDGTPMPRKYKYIEPYVDSLVKDQPGEHLFEHKMALTEKLEVCDFGDTKRAWVRGIADYIRLSPDRKNALLVDYKTGKSQYADTKQLQLLSLMLFNHVKELDEIRGGLLFVIPGELVDATFIRDKEEEYWAPWRADVKRLHASFEADTWNPKSNFTCKNFCPVTDCEYNGSF